jgi:predicted branched-subunit amino acid permease
VFAALFMLTPMYFLTSLWRSARERAGQIAMVSGIVLFPIFHQFTPGYDLLLTGIFGGLISFAFHRSRKASKEALQ